MAIPSVHGSEVAQKFRISNAEIESSSVFSFCGGSITFMTIRVAQQLMSPGILRLLIQYGLKNGLRFSRRPNVEKPRCCSNRVFADGAQVDGAQNRHYPHLS
jgi:hypothetical protein